MERALSTSLSRATAQRTEREVDSLLEESRPALFRLALAIMASRDRAEDVTQDALLRASRSRSALASVDEPSAWLRTTLVRCAMSALKRRPQIEVRPGASRDPALDLSVAATLNRLSPADRTLLALAHFQEMSYAEISELLGIPEGTVASRLHTARAAFRKEWKE